MPHTVIIGETFCYLYIRVNKDYFTAFTTHHVIEFPHSFLTPHIYFIFIYFNFTLSNELQNSVSVFKNTLKFKVET